MYSYLRQGLAGSFSVNSTQIFRAVLIILCEYSSCNNVQLLCFSAPNIWVVSQIIHHLNRVAMFCYLFYSRYLDSNTYTAEGIRLVRDMFSVEFGDRPDVPNVQIIITDGESTINNETTVPEAVTSRALGIQVK